MSDERIKVELGEDLYNRLMEFMAKTGMTVDEVMRAAIEAMRDDERNG